MSTKNSIQVGIKLRPLLAKEKEQSNYWRVVNNSIQLMESTSDPYYFDYIFDEDSKNEDIFDRMAKHIVHSSIQGFNGTIFAYGQTSSGKTYTMMGDKENPGVMVLAAKEIFKEIEKCSDRQFLLRVGYIEIYNEKICDLLNKKNQDLKIHETPTGLVSVNCEENIITSQEGLLHYLCMGNKERTVGGTLMNEHSSRSHAIFRIIIESRKIDRTEDDTVIQSVLNLVDLAGSERAYQTGAIGARLKEGASINKSLLFLSNVIKKLSENEDDKYISYRDTKLTRILQASLGGNALTSIICTIKPTTVDETQSTLNFAMRAKSIKNKPKVNEFVSDATMMKRLESEIRELKIRLDKERRKNESQIKVGELEERIKTEVLKIITCNSLHNIRSQREKRRRTWCPTSSIDTDNSMTTSVHSDMVSVRPSSSTNTSDIPSRLPKPNVYFTPHITLLRYAKETESAAASDTGNLNGSSMEGMVAIKEENDDFISGEFFKFERISEEYSDDCKTPHNKIPNRVSMTPVGPASLGTMLEIVENNLQELQEFTNLESKIDVKYDIHETLKQKLQLLTERNAVLEQEHLQFIQVQEELETTRQSLSNAEKNCNELQIEISKLVKANQTTKIKQQQHEEELSQLRAQIKRLEMENRDAISLQFKFEQHQNKSKQRESELLDALDDKNKEITKLENSLKSMRDFHSSREDLMQCSSQSQSVCTKCEDLASLQERNQKVVAEFEKLTQEYEKLQLDYAEATMEAANARTKLAELEQTQQSDLLESEKLLREIMEMRQKLEDVQHEYVQLQCDHNAKSEACERLNKVVDATREEVRALQQKYDQLEIAWNAQQQTLADIQTDYDAIQSKYENLQCEYEKLEQKSREECARLQQANEALHAEINELTARIQEVQKKLLTAAHPSSDAESIAQLQQTNEKLSQDLRASQAKFDELQQEYDVLSNDVMDNLLEAESLKEKCNKLEAQLQQTAVEADKTAPEEIKILKANKTEMELQINELQRELKMLCVNKTIETETNVEVLDKFAVLLETLQEIELEHGEGKSRIYHARNIATTNRTYKLCLRNIEAISTKEQPEDAHDDKLQMHGQLTRHTFHIVELEQSGGVNGVDELSEMREQLQELQSVNARLCEEKQALLETTERTIGEMREQMQQLTAELFEKSTYVEDYQKQIENLERDRAEMTIVYDQLQDKLKECADNTLQKELEDHDVPDNDVENMKEAQTELNNLQAEMTAKVAELEALQMKCVVVEMEKLAERKEYEKKLLELESAFESVKSKLASQELEYKRECDRLQLELLSKFEVHENELRENLRDYKNQWEQREQTYEEQIGQLQNSLSLCKCDGKVDVAVDEHNCGTEEVLTLEIVQGKMLESTILKLTENCQTEAAESVEEFVATQENFAQLKQLRVENEQMELQKNEALKALEAEIEQLQMCVERLDEEKRALESNNVELNQKLTQLQNALDTLEGDKQELERLHQLESEGLCDEIEKFSNVKQTLEVEKREMQQKIDTAQHAHQDQLMQLQSHISKLETERTQLLNNEAAQNEELIRLRNERESLEADRLQALCEKKEQLIQLGNALELLEAERTQMLEIKEEQAKQITHLECELEKLKVVVKELSSNNKLLQAEHRENCEQLASIRAEVEAKNLLLEQEQAAKCKVLQERKDEINEMQLKLNDVKNEILSVVAQNNKLLLDRAENEEIVAALRVELLELKEQAESVAALKSRHEQSMLALRAERNELRETLVQQQQAQTLLVEREETLRLKIESLLQKLHESNEKSLIYEKLLAELDDLQTSHAQANETQIALNARVQELEMTLAEKSASNLRLQKELQEMQNERQSVCAQQQILQSRIDELTEQLAVAQTALSKQIQELQSALNELQLKNQTLTSANDKLSTLNASLAKQLKSVQVEANASAALREKLAKAQATHDEMARNMQQRIDKVTDELAQHKAQHNELQQQLLKRESAFQLEKQKLQVNIAVAQQDKKMFEGKLLVAEMALKKAENELAAVLAARQGDGSMQNSSLDNSNSSNSPRARRSLDGKFLNLNVEDKLSALQQRSSQQETTERKNRRLSTHDENRRQSFWGVGRDVGCMTDPTDENCKCLELDGKLQTCRKNLFIRESQVAALNMELKSNPLKGENAALIKRLQEEQEKHRADVKKYKQMVIDQKAKTVQAIEAAKRQAAPAVVIETPTAAKVHSNSVETQTETELETLLKKLQSKYESLEQICRSRYKMIVELQGKVAQKENANENENVPPTSQNANREKTLEKQCETLQQELKILGEKYLVAKKVLHSRREEIHRLRDGIEQDTT